VLEVLRELGPEARAAVPRLIRLLESPDEKVRGWAIGTLERIGEAARPAIPALVRRALDEQETRRIQAMMALHSLRPTAREAAPLRPLLADKDNNVHFSAALSLAHLPSLEAEVLPILRTTLKTEIPLKQVMVAMRLVRM